MATAGPNLATSGTNSGVIAWTSPNAITAADSIFTTCANGIGGASGELIGSAFGFSIPAGATINGIQVDINRKQSNVGTINDFDVTLRKAGVATGTNLASGLNWTGTATTITYGGPSNLWGAAWTPSDINNANFGVQMSTVEATSTNAASSLVDWMKITITYTPAATNTSAGFFML